MSAGAPPFLIFARGALAQTILLVAQAVLRVAHVRLAIHTDKSPNSGQPSPANGPRGKAVETRTAAH